MAKRLILVSTFGVFLTCPAWAQGVQPQQIGSTGLAFSASSLQGPARKIMRLSDGKIYGSFLSDKAGSNQLRLFAADKRNVNWRDVTGSDTQPSVRSVTSDTGPVGTYVSVINEAARSGEILLFPDPISSPGRQIRFSSLTPSSDALQDGFIAASKGEEATNSVAYAWRDAEKKQLLVGVSNDGRNFPPANPVVTDPYLQSGPTLAVHNNYVLLSYLSTDAAFSPKLQGTSGKAFPVWTESWDSGRTWTKPRAVLGQDPSRLPKVDYAVVGVNEATFRGNLLGAGGALQAANTLAWAQPQIGARIFVLSGQAVVSPENNSPPEFKDGAPTVAVLAFKDLSDGPEAPWQTVVASAPQGNSRAAAAEFQYSALPGTSIRAVAYRTAAQKPPTAESEGITVSISTNTGRSFDKSAFLSKKSLGLLDKDPLIFTSSTCVYKNDNGDLFLDVAYLDKSNELKATQVALGVNLRELPASMFNTAARWP